MSIFCCLPIYYVCEVQQRLLHVANGEKLCGCPHLYSTFHAGELFNFGSQFVWLHMLFRCVSASGVMGVIN